MKTHGKRIALLLLLGTALFVVGFSDRIKIAYCAATKTPRSGVIEGSPMKSLLSYVWANWGQEGLAESTAVRQLSDIVRRELSQNSTEEEVREHLRAHYRQPIFSGYGASPASIWHQSGHGYGSFLLDGHRMIEVRYFLMNDRFLYADLRMSTPKDTDLRQIDLTPSVDVWKALNQTRTNGEQASAADTSPRGSFQRQTNLNTNPAMQPRSQRGASRL